MARYNVTLVPGLHEHRMWIVTLSEVTVVKPLMSVLMRSVYSKWKWIFSEITLVRTSGEV
jgi:hypothetical protein